MAKVEIVKSLAREIEKRFKGESKKITDLMRDLEKNPHKGTTLGHVGGLAIKEIRYKSFRFYFIVDSYKLKFFSLEELTELLIKFVRMSDKKDQQKVINEIKNILRMIGESGLV